jgi:hypothetical protein
MNKLTTIGGYIKSLEVLLEKHKSINLSASADEKLAQDILFKNNEGILKYIMIPTLEKLVEEKQFALTDSISIVVCEKAIAFINKYCNTIKGYKQAIAIFEQIKQS